MMIKDASIPVTAPSDIQKKSFNILDKVSFVIPSREQYQIEGMDILPRQGLDNINIYTDGSKRNDIAGSGIYSDELRWHISVPQGKFASVFQAEVNAISVAIRQLLDANITGESVCLHSDSAAAIKALKNPLSNSRTINYCKELLKELSLHNVITISWVPGHSGIIGNEHADVLAGQATTGGYQGPEPFALVPNTSVKEATRRWCSNEAANYWRNMATCRQAKNLTGSFEGKRSTTLMEFSRPNIGIIISVLTGHGPFNYHLYKMGLSDTSDCCLCGEIDTSQHYLCSCPAYNMARSLTLGQLVLNLEDARSITPKQLMAYLKLSARLIN